MTTFRILINVSAILGWDIFTIDVSQAYTQGELLDDIYVHAPRSHPLPKGVVYKLRRPLYGTKQAGRCWYLHVTKTLRSLGLNQLCKDSCLLVKMSNSKPFLIISVLVDDLLVTAENDEVVKQFHKEFSGIYKVSQFERIKVYNGIHIKRLGKNCYTLNQEYSIAQFLAKCPVQEINACNSPLLPSDTFVLATKDDEHVVDREKKEMYQQVLGSLNWFNTATRPDLAVVCSLAGRVASNPTQKQLKSLCRAVGYLKRNPNIPLIFDGTRCNGVVKQAGFSDADWAGQKLSLNSEDRCGRKSTSGYIAFSCGPTNWKSKLQGIPATSSAQAEFMAMYEAAKDLFFQILLLRELGFKLSRVPLFCDNTTAIRQAMETMSSKSNKHMEIRYAWLQHYAHREGIIQPFNIASSHNLADVLTKILPNKKNFSGTTDVHECSNHYNVMLGHIFSKDIQAFINQRLKEGMVKSDALQTYQAYLEKVESEETQPFRGGDGARLQTRES